MAPIGDACCGGPGEDCSTGLPSTCDADCGGVLLPFQASCAGLLGQPENAGLKSLIDTAAGLCAPPPPPSTPFSPQWAGWASLEFYFGTAIPADAAPGAVLDDGTGFKRNRDGGLDYGWDCEGDTNVDYSSGRRGLDRDGGLGINHFDRDGQCPGDVNWQIAVPNGDYIATVDFGESGLGARDGGVAGGHQECTGTQTCRGTIPQHGCQMEGVAPCPDGQDCVVYRQPVTVDDGFFTLTGDSHDDGTCHSISLVRLEKCEVGCTVAPPAPPPPPGSLFKKEFFFGTELPHHASPSAILDDGTGFKSNRDGGLGYGWDW